MNKKVKVAIAVVGAASAGVGIAFGVKKAMSLHKSKTTVKCGNSKRANKVHGSNKLVKSGNKSGLDIVVKPNAIFSPVVIIKNS